MLLFQDSYFGNYCFHPWTPGFADVPLTISAIMNYHSTFTSPQQMFEEKSDDQNLCELPRVHASGEQHLHQEAELGPTTTAHPSLIPQNSRSRLTHCPHVWSQPSVVKCGCPMFKNSEVSFDFWNIPKEPRTHSPSLELLQLLLEINLH